MRDMHNNIKVLTAITPAAVGTSGIAGGKLSGIIDRQGYDSVEFAFNYSTAGASTDQIVPVVYEAAATGDSFTSVADDDLLGSEAAIVIAAAGAGKIGYKGNKRYLKLRLYGVGHATGTVGAIAILGNPNQAPVA